MPIELKIPEVGESITEVQINEWLKAEGDAVEKDEAVAVIDSEKTTFELPAPESGTLAKILHQAGETVNVGTVVAQIEAGTAAAKETRQEGAQRPVAPAHAKAAEAKTARRSDPEAKPAAEAQPETKASAPADQAQRAPTPAKERANTATEREEKVSAAAERPQKKESAEKVTEKAERLDQTKITRPAGRKTTPAADPEAKRPAAKPSAPPTPRPAAPNVSGDREEEVVPMTMLRRTVARRLVEAQQSMAMLTTFNEIDMSAVQALRKEHQEAFEKRYQVKLGLMSFFVKAVIDPLKQFPQLNAEIRDNDIVYHNYFDIGVAIGTGRGLVVPVLRNAERLSFAEIETAIGELARRAQSGELKPENLEGGTFTITNGGVFGSLLSTPIINPPQSGILGLHAIQERPVAIAGQVAIRPMMYVALTYDHRIVDGREAVTFLRRLKEVVETPARMLIEV